MPSKKRRIFTRLRSDLPYKKLFVIAVEGAKTEPQYFSLFNNQQSLVRVECLKKGPHRSSPLQALKRIKERLKQERLKDSSLQVGRKDTPL